NGSTAEILVRFGSGKKLKPAKYTLTVDSGQVQDNAGNPLTGAFSGTLPTGGSPGSPFQVVYNVKSNGAAKGPTPVVLVGKAHPKGRAVRTFAANHQASVPKGALVDLHLAKAHS